MPCYAPTAQVLGIFPTTIRRKILRQLYSNPLNECYLFKNTGVKFLDALMLGARVELFLPKVISGSRVQGSGFRVSTLPRVSGLWGGRRFWSLLQLTNLGSTCPSLLSL